MRTRLSRAALFASLALAACGGTDDDGGDPSAVVRDPAARGPWQVGVTTIEVSDPAWPTRDLLIELWYPATHAVDAERDQQLGIELSSVRGAAPDHRGGPFPLVGFSHGNQGVRFQSVYLTEHLASHGFVVVAPDHPGNTIGDDDDARRGEVLRGRPYDVQRALDAALARSATDGDLLAGMIDGEHVGMVGHSYGAWTTLALAGAHVDAAAARAACAADPSALVCDGIDEGLTQAIADGFPDARLDAAVAMSPAGGIAFGADGLGRVAAPVQLQSGSLDGLATPDGDVVPIFDGLPAPRALAMVTGAGHFSFTDICALFELTGGLDGPLAFTATEGCGPNTIPVERVHAASRTLATAFLDRELRGLADERGYLDPARGVADTTLR